ncbi:MAG: DUF6291 domain-containing protein [Rhabdochlamydiaceae bacterium]
MQKKSFILYTDMYEGVDALTDEQAGQLFKNIFQYIREEPFSNAEMQALIAFQFIKPHLDRNSLKYEKEIKSKSEGGKKAAQKRWSITKNKILKDRMHDNVNDNVNVNDIYKESKESSDELSLFLEEFNLLFKTKYRETLDRRKKIKLRRKTYSLEELLMSVRKLAKSSFHKGKNDRNWKADPDFLLRNDEQVDKWLNYKEKEKENQWGEFSEGHVIRSVEDIPKFH